MKELREQENLKIYDISRLLGLDKDTYGKFEREYITIPLVHLNTLCNYFQISLDYIFGFSNIRKYENYIENIDLKLSGSRLKKFRKEINKTQSSLAKELGCSYGTIAGYESGRYLIATPFLYQICKDYHVSADYLLGKIDSFKY